MVQATDIVQINEYAGRPDLIGCCVVVLEPKAWGLTGYIQIPDNKQLHVRIPNGGYEVIGKAVLVHERSELQSYERSELQSYERSER